MLLKKISKLDKTSLQQIFNGIPLFKHRYFGSLPSDYVATLDNDTFGFIHTQPRKMQGEHLIMFAHSCQKLYSAGSLDQPSFFKQQYEQIMPEPLKPHSNVCGFCAINAAFQLLKFRQGEVTGVRNVIERSHISNNM